MIEKILEPESNYNENFSKIRESLLIEVKNFRTLVVCRLRNVNHWWNIGLTVTGVTLTAITTILGVIDSEALKNWLKFGIALTGSAAVATQSAHREFRVRGKAGKYKQAEMDLMIVESRISSLEKETDETELQKLREQYYNIIKRVGEVEAELERDNSQK